MQSLENRSKTGVLLAVKPELGELEVGLGRQTLPLSALSTMLVTHLILGLVTSDAGGLVECLESVEGHLGRDRRVLGSC